MPSENTTKSYTQYSYMDTIADIMAHSQFYEVRAHHHFLYNLQVLVVKTTLHSQTTSWSKYKVLRPTWFSLQTPLKFLHHM